MSYKLYVMEEKSVYYNFYFTPFCLKLITHNL